MWVISDLLDTSTNTSTYQPPRAPGRLDHQESIDEPVPGVENWNPGPDVSMNC